MITLTLLIAIPWTIIVILVLHAEYKTNKTFNWFKYPDRVFSHISHIMTHITLGIAIWSNVFILLTIREFISFITLGILFMIISTGFSSIHTNRLNKRVKKIMEKWKNGSNGNC